MKRENLNFHASFFLKIFYRANPPRVNYAVKINKFVKFLLCILVLCLFENLKFENVALYS